MTSVKTNSVSDTCHYSQRQCTKQYSPSLCEIPEYTLSKGRFLSRGKNPCLARNEIMAKLCAAGIERIDSYLVNCAPDPTMDECWQVDQANCDKDKKDIKSPHTCVVEQYAGRKLTPELAPRSYANTLCHASNALLKVACDASLKPSGIEKLHCEPTTILAQCTPVSAQCEKTLIPTRCSAEIDPKNDISLSATNECIARHQLRKRLCQLHINPDKISKIQCQTIQSLE